MSNERHCYGPPGAGKTTWVRRQALRAINEGFYSPEDLLFCSFTRAAAHELAGRDLPVADRRQIGTLHSLCYHALGRPEIAEAYITSSNKEHIKPWNEYCPPRLRMTAGRVSVDEMANDGKGASEGDDIFAEIERCRALRLPMEAWSMQAQYMYKLWRKWCDLHHLVSFTDLIERAVERIPVAPGDPRVGFFDECQDFTPLQIQLVRKWGQSMDYFILAGDANQCIYSWLGATPSTFLDADIPEENKHRLRRSWRMWSAVHEAAGSWISRASEAEIFDFEPYGQGGAVSPMNASYATPEPIIEMADYLNGVGKSVMILGATSYMLDPVKHALRDAALPFHNPYRRRRGDWNPLHASGGTSTAERLHSYLAPTDLGWGRLWLGKDLKNWLPLIKATGTLKRGKWKAELERLPDDEPVGYGRMLRIFEQPALSRLFSEGGVLRDPDPAWLVERLQKSKIQSLQFPLEVVRRRGSGALCEEPKTILGTIHSVKGGEADVVLLIPDLSPSGFRQWTQSGKPRDAVIRQFYVGLSRAREAVFILQPGSGFFVEGLGQ